ncbi:MAG TPA: isoaspartyl peptidase/L-asparaginase [Kofleriaceae bacterium]|nr:isoaspartyl peptidase/L-asparaginase [Kofleriaceae bacterium]
MILVHGGAGQVAPDRQERVRAGLRAAAAAGRAILERGGTALDAVVGAVRVLEDDPEFGAGIGSAFTREGTVETCASVMDGSKRRAGAVAAVPNFGMPVVLARAVLEAGEHVVLAGGAALQYASEIGMQPAAPNGLVTERSAAQFRQAQAHRGAPPGFNEGGGVGAVARDKTGAMAAATSTGGTLYRRAGAIDDSAVPGAGTWADTDCAISTSGGEALFRVALAHNIAMRVADGKSIRAAAKSALQELKKLAPKEAVAGAIMVSKDSWAALNVGPHMPVAWIDDFGPNEAMGFEL